MERVTYKEFEVKKLEDFNLNIFEGEILGFIPVNLHGLSSFIKLLQTNLPLYDGYVYYNDIVINSWERSLQNKNKITIIQKNSSLVQGLSVADNIFVLRQGYKSEYIRPELLGKQLQFFLEEVGLEIQAGTYVEQLSIFERTVVELLKGVIAGHRLIVLNEMDTLLTGQELEKLHAMIRYYASKGFTFIYICLHAEDIVHLCHRAVLFRNGRIEKNLQSHELTIEKLLSITGDYDHLIRTYLSDKAHESQEVKFYQMSYRFMDAKATLDIRIKQAECMAIHCKNTDMYYELRNAIINKNLGVDGSIQEDCHSLSMNGNKEVAIIQELPSKTMLFPQMTYLDNLCFNLDSRMKGVWLRSNIRKSISREYGETYGHELFETPVEQLSEKQKYQLVYTRVLLQKPKIVFCIQPFQGADLDHRMHIWTLLESLIKKNISVVMIAVNLSDSLSIVDRLIQIDEKGLQKEYTRHEFAEIPLSVPWKHLY